MSEKKNMLFLIFQILLLEKISRGLPHNSPNCRCVFLRYSDFPWGQPTQQCHRATACRAKKSKGVSKKSLKKWGSWWGQTKLGEAKYTGLFRHFQELGKAPLLMGKCYHKLCDFDVSLPTTHWELILNRFFFPHCGHFSTRCNWDIAAA